MNQIGMSGTRTPASKKSMKEAEQAANSPEKAGEASPEKIEQATPSVRPNLKNRDTSLENANHLQEDHWQEAH